jgi:hypothetical protein
VTFPEERRKEAGMHRAGRQPFCACVPLYFQEYLACREMDGDFFE